VLRPQNLSIVQDWTASPEASGPDEPDFPLQISLLRWSSEVAGMPAQGWKQELAPGARL
jgi:hypothetical protein